MLCLGGIGAVFIGISAIFVYRHFTEPERLRDRVSRSLREALPCPVSLGPVRFSIFDGVSIDDLAIGPTNALMGDTLADSARPTPSSISLRCERIVLEHDPFQLLLGHFRLHRVALRKPVLDLVGDFKSASTMMGELRDRVRDRGARADRPLPLFDVQDGQVRLFAAGGTEPALLDEVPLSLRAVPLGSSRSVFDIAWQGPQGQTGLAQMDVKNRRFRDVRGGSPWISVEAALGLFSRTDRPVSVWRRRLGASGMVRAYDFDVPLGSMRVEYGATLLQVRNGAIAFPAGRAELERAPADRYLRLENFDGQVVLKTDDLRVEGEGDLGGGRTRLSGQFSGGLRAFRDAAGASWWVTVESKALDIPASDELTESQRRAIGANRTVQSLYDELDPAGPIHLRVEIAKDAGSENKPLLRRVVVSPQGARARPDAFPVPIVQITGEVEVKPDGVAVRAVCGDRAGGAVCAEGWFETPKSCSPAELKIAARDVPIDEALFEALGPQRSPIKELLNPAGRIDIHVTTARPACVDGHRQPWDTTTTVHLNELTARYAELPYHMERITGTVVIEKDSVQIAAAGEIEGAPITAQGQVVSAEPSQLRLEVSAEKLPIDERMLEALPPSTRAIVETFHPSGHLAVRAFAYQEPGRRPAIGSATVELLGVSVQHDQFPIPIDDLRGRLEILPTETRISHLVGRYGEAQVSVDGFLPGWSPEPGAVQPARVSIGFLNLRIDQQIAAAAPRALAEQLSTWAVDGPLAGEILVSRATTGDAGPQTLYRAEVRLDSVQVTHAALPAAIRGVSGMLFYDESGVRGEDLHGLYGSASVRADIQAGAERGRISLTATGMRLDENFFALFPGPTAATLRRLQPSGYADLLIDRLSYTRTPDQNIEWAASGTIQVQSIDLPPLKMSDVSGEVTLSGILRHPQDGTLLAGEIYLEHATILDRNLTRLETPWSLVRTNSGVGELSFDRVRADIYGGQVSGRSGIRFDSAGAEYNLTGVISRMDLTEFLNAGRLSSEPVEAKGQVLANLYLSGEFGDPGSTRGGGRFEVIEGDLYQLPIMLAILNVLELKIRPTDSFNEATADFYIVGSKITLRDIVVRGGVLALVGSGTLTLPDLAADLRLINVPDQWWAKLPGLSQVMQGAVRELAQVRVTGPMSQPSVRTEPVPRVTEELRSLFQRRERRPR